MGFMKLYIQNEISKNIRPKTISSERHLIFKKQQNITISHVEPVLHKTLKHTCYFLKECLWYFFSLLGDSNLII